MISMNLRRLEAEHIIIGTFYCIPRVVADDGGLSSGDISQACLEGSAPPYYDDI